MFFLIPNFNHLISIRKSNEIFYLITLGPKMPYAINGPSMITSPTEKGVLIISGMKSEVYPNKSGSVSRLSKMTPDIFELSGDCFNTLKWSKLDHKLQYPRFRHLSFLISNELFVKLGRNYSS